MNMHRLLVVLVLIFICSSCKKNGKEKVIQEMQVEFFLLPSHVVKFKQITNNSILKFVNASGDTIVMRADPPGHSWTYPPGSTRKGEQFVQYYNCSSSYLQTFKIGYQMEAVNDSVSQLSLVSISGDLQNTDRSQNYYATFSKIKLLNMDTASYDSVQGFDLQLYDSVNIGSKVYRNGYYLDKLHSFGMGPLSDYFYFDPFVGYIKFNSRDGKVWELIN